MDEGQGNSSGPENGWVGSNLATWKSSKSKAFHEKREGDPSWQALHRLGPRYFKQYSQTSWVEMSELVMRYAIVIEDAGNNFSAYVPDLPGCVAAAETVEETEQLIREAIAFHIEGLKEDNLPVPTPSSRVEYVEVAA